MQGRLENEMKLLEKAEKKLEQLPEYVTDWYKYMRASYMTASTCRDYIFKVALFLETIDKDTRNIKVEDITEPKVMQFMITINTRVVNGETIETSDSYKNTVWYALNSFLGYLAQNGMIKKNYIENVKKKRNKDLEKINKNRIRLTIEDFNNLLNVINKENSRYPERDKAIVLLYMYTGMRKTALSSINIEDIDKDKKVLSIVDKGDKIHNYVLDDKEIQAINTWMEKRNKFQHADETSALFISNLGNRISGDTLMQMIKRYTEMAFGNAMSPHKLRAGFITIMYEKTGDIEKVRRMVGHSSVSTTQRYIVTKSMEKEEATEIMGSLLK